MTPTAETEALTRRLGNVMEDMMEADNVAQKKRHRVVPARDAVGDQPSFAEVKPPAPLSIKAPVPIKAETDAFRELGGSAVPAFNSVILRETLGVVWVAKDEPDGTTRHIQAAAAALRAFRPADEIEGMLAAQATAMHFAAMECFRRSILNEQPAEIAAKLRKDGANLARAMTEMLDALDRKRGKGGQQKVTVEHVHVHSGGQAIVGAVTPAAPGGRG